jgi:glycosyltransferase involved in cell wall biosynthesis
VRIAFILTDFDFGGMPTWVYTLATRLASRHELHFLGTDVERIAPKFSAVGRPQFVGHDWRRLRRYLRDHHIDIVQYGNRRIFGECALAAGVPVVVERTGGQRRLRESKRGLDAVIASSAGTVPIIAHGTSRDRIHVIHNGVDVARFATAAPDRLDFGSGDVVIGTLTRFGRGKNLALLLDAVRALVARHPHVRLALVGGNSRMPGAEDHERVLRAGASGLEAHVRFVGQVEDPASLAAGFDIGACTSVRGGEGIPNALIECMAAGKPVVSTEVGDVSELVEDGTHGLLVPDGDLAALVAALERLVVDAGLRATLGARAQARVARDFDVDVQARKYEALFESLLAAKRNRSLRVRVAHALYRRSLRVTVAARSLRRRRPAGIVSGDAERGTLASTAMVLFFTRGMSVDGWRRAGILERELALYRELAKRLGSIAFLTYGGGADARHDEFTVLANGWKLGSNIYSLAAPLLHARALRSATVLKTNQLNGAWTGVIAKRLWRKPLIVRCGFPWAANVAEEGASGVKRALARRLEGWVCRAADVVVAPSAEIARTLATTHGVPPARFRVVPNYVDTALFRPRADIAAIPGLVCAVGRLSSEKNLLMLVDAIASLPQVRLALIGDGPERAAIERHASERGVAVTFHGIVPHPRVAELLTEAEVFVMPSRYEGSPKALTEAMACRLAVVGTNVRGIRDVIQAERTGVLCEPTPAAISAAVAALLRDRERRQRLGHAARAWVEQECSLSAVVERELDIVAMVTGRR